MTPLAKLIMSVLKLVKNSWNTFCEIVENLWVLWFNLIKFLQVVEKDPNLNFIYIDFCTKPTQKKKIWNFLSSDRRVEYSKLNHI